MRFILRWLFLLWCGALIVVAVPVATNAAPPQGTPDTYIVQAGDTLFVIAARYHTTVAAIKQLNGLGNNDTIQVGQKLLVPVGDNAGAGAPALALTTHTYIVQPEDTLARIASRYGVTVRAVEQLNGLANANLIVAGQALAIPANPNLVKPGLLIEPTTARQGGTVLVQLTRPELAAVKGMFNNRAIEFTRSAGYFYALLGVSRCAKIAPAPLTLTLTDTDGQTTTETATIQIAAATFAVQQITLPAGKGALLDNALQVREGTQLVELVNQRTPARLWSGAWRLPVVGPISSAFGTRRSYNGGAVGACGHEGTDFDVDAGVLVHAPARGKVMFAAATQVRGNLVVLDHGAGIFSAYYHLAAIDTQVGQIVAPGTLLGKVGTTGLSTGPHLHWSMWVNGEYVDPLEWTRRALP